MAIYSVQLRPFSRAKGESAVAAAAYRAGVALTDQRTGLSHDYTKRHGVESVELVLPAHAPAWAKDPAELWNRAEASESRINARVARELLVALPHELPQARRQALAHDIGRHLVDTYGVAVQVAVHAPDRQGDGRNHHAHLLMTTRALGAAGLNAKIRCLDDQKQGPEEVKTLRAVVADLTNRHLADLGLAERVDHRTLVAQAEEAEAQGEFDKAAKLTREPLKRLPRADIEAARRGAWVASVAENRTRKAEGHLALMDYLAQAQAEHRLMPGASDALTPKPVKPTWMTPARTALPWHAPAAPRGPLRGPGAAALRSQAAQQAQAAQQSRKTAEAYLRGVEATASEGKRWLDEFAALAGHRHALEAELSATANGEALDLLRRTVESWRELRRLEELGRTARRDHQQASQARQAHQRAADQHDAGKAPGRWAWRAKKVWEAERRQRWADLRKAIAAEGDARASVDGAQDHGRARIRALRAELRSFEQSLRLVTKLGPPVPQPPRFSPARPRVRPT